MKGKAKVTSRERSEFIWGWLFILPTMIGLIVLNIIPIFQTIYQSFFKTGDFGIGNIFVGVQNYEKLFADADVWQALINTFKYETQTEENIVYINSNIVCYCSCVQFAHCSSEQRKML